MNRRDREGRRGGGVAAYIHKDISTDVLTFIGDKPEYELLWLQLKGTFRTITLGIIYHPPKPIYDTQVFLNYIENCVSLIELKYNDSIILLAGDMNTLPDNSLLSNTGLISIVKEPTRGNSFLDKIFSSEPI